MPMAIGFVASRGCRPPGGATSWPAPASFTKNRTDTKVGSPLAEVCVPAGVARSPYGDRGNTPLLGPGDREVGRVAHDQVPEATAAVKTGDGARVEFDRRLGIGDDLAVAPTLYVLGEPSHPVRLMTGEICVDDHLSHELSVIQTTAEPEQDCARESPKLWRFARDDEGIAHEQPRYAFERRRSIDRCRMSSA